MFEIEVNEEKKGTLLAKATKIYKETIDFAF